MFKLDYCSWTPTWSRANKKARGEPIPIEYFVIDNRIWQNGLRCKEDFRLSPLSMGILELGHSRVTLEELLFSRKYMLIFRLPLTCLHDHDLWLYRPITTVCVQCVSMALMFAQLPFQWEQIWLPAWKFLGTRIRSCPIFWLISTSLPRMATSCLLSL